MGLDPQLAPPFLKDGGLRDIPHPVFPPRNILRALVSGSSPQPGWLLGDDQEAEVPEAVPGVPTDLLI